jgi:prevent-host-death family protein
MTVTDTHLERITHRDLRNNSAEILRRVAAGESFEVTNHGVVVGVLTPPRTRELERLRAAGRTRRPSKSWTDPWEVPAVQLDESSDEVLADLRGDR